MFGCVATLSETHSIRQRRKPPFISRLAAEDRCHLNGLALADGVPRYVSAVSKTDVADGWREKRREVEPRCGLLVIDLNSGDIVHWLRREGVVEELYDVVVLPGVARPMALGLVSDEIRRTVSLENDLPAAAPQ